MSARIQLPETRLFLLFFNNSREQRGFGRKPLKDFFVGKASLCANDKRGELFLFRHGVNDNDNGPIEGSIKIFKSPAYLRCRHPGCYRPFAAQPEPWASCVSSRQAAPRYRSRRFATSSITLTGAASSCESWVVNTLAKRRNASPSK